MSFPILLVWIFREKNILAKCWVLRPFLSYGRKLWNERIGPVISKCRRSSYGIRNRRNSPTCLQMIKRNQPAHEPKFSTEWSERVEFRTMTYLDFQLCIWNQWKERTFYIETKLCTHACNFHEDVFWQCLISLLSYLPRNNECCLALCRKTQSISHSSIRHSPCPTWAIYPSRTKLQRFFLFVLHLNFTSIKQLRLGSSNYIANLICCITARMLVTNVILPWT